jgi:hypothetical protein
MNEAQFAYKVRHVLNQGTGLDAPTAERLRAARMRALEAHRPHSELVPAWAGASGDWPASLAGFTFRVLLPVALVLLSAFALRGWQERQHLTEIEEIDSELLTDDLPIDALLDRGFQVWLKKRAAR